MRERKRIKTYIRMFFLSFHFIFIWFLFSFSLILFFLWKAHLMQWECFEYNFDFVHPIAKAARYQKPMRTKELLHIQTDRLCISVRKNKYIQAYCILIRELLLCVSFMKPFGVFVQNSKRKGSKSWSLKYEKC